MKKDIFASVLADETVSPEAKTVLVLHLVVVVVPIVDGDVTGGGLNS